MPGFAPPKFCVSDYSDLSVQARSRVVALLNSVQDADDPEGVLPPVNRLPEGFRAGGLDHVLVLLERGVPFGAMHFKSGDAYTIDKVAVGQSRAVKRFVDATGRKPSSELLAHFIAALPPGHERFESTPRTPAGTRMMRSLLDARVLSSMTEGRLPRHEYVLAAGSRESFRPLVGRA